MNCQSGQSGSHGLIEISVWLRLKAGGIAPTSFPKWEQPVLRESGHRIPASADTDGSEAIRNLGLVCLGRSDHSESVHWDIEPWRMELNAARMKKVTMIMAKFAAERSLGCSIDVEQNPEMMKRTAAVQAPM